MTEERALESGRSTSRDEDHLGNERYSKMKKSMTGLPNQSKSPQTHSSCVTSLMQTVPTLEESMIKE